MVVEVVEMEMEEVVKVVVEVVVEMVVVGIRGGGAGPHWTSRRQEK